MQPDFALTLSSEGVELHSASPEGWAQLGRIRFSGRSVGPHMAVLRRLARAHRPEGPLNVLLVVPEDQVLWRSVPQNEGAATDQARSELTGLTPYRLDELRFDWREDAGTLQIAAIAMETMAEAESFASAYGFEPRGVVAPGTEGFPGTAWFGLSTDPQSAVGADLAEAPRIGPDTAPPISEDEVPTEVLTPSSRKDDGGTERAQRRRRVPTALLLSALLLAALLVAALVLPGRATEVLSWVLPQLRIEMAADVTETAPPPPQPETIAAATAGVAARAAIAALPDHWVPSPRPLSDRRADDLDRLPMPGPDRMVPLDAVSLTVTALASLPEPPAALPARGTVYDIDTSGLVRATAAGARAPGGYRVVAGRPLAAPGARPDVPVIPEPVTRLGSLDDPLGQQRPLLRPEGLTERFERAMLGGRSLAELGRLRPDPRPAALAAAALARDAARRSAVELAVARAHADITRPAPRPAGLAARQAALETAAAAAARSAAARATSASVAAIDRQPQAQTRSTPQRPAVPEATPRKSPENVASGATDRGFALNQINLLGTFGRPGDLRALVRLSSGRVLNLSVGDRVDGGRVVAISQSELRYVKNGRNLTLGMPRG